MSIEIHLSFNFLGSTFSMIDAARAIMTLTGQQGIMTTAIPNGEETMVATLAAMLNGVIEPALAAQLHSLCPQVCICLKKIFKLRYKQLIKKENYK